MQFGLTETQQVLKNSAREFFPAECPIAEVRRLMETDTAFDAALWKKIAGQGWCGIIFPEEYDGLGLGMVELAAAMEEMGRADPRGRGGRVDRGRGPAPAAGRNYACR